MGGSEVCVDLLEEEYLRHPIFKKRVEADFSLLDGEVGFGDIEEVIKKEGRDKVLVEFIKKSTAREFYDYIKELEGYEVYLLTGDDNRLYRQKVIERCKEPGRVVLVSTQVIEAGVDIDMDLGLKDVSILESEEQFAGRINRNACGKGRVYFFDLDEAAKVYRGDLRLAFGIGQNREIFVQKRYGEYYQKLLEALRRQGNRREGVRSRIDEFREHVRGLDFGWVRKQMRLIDKKSFTIFLPFRIDVAEYGLEVDGEFLSDGLLDGRKVWQALKELESVESYAARMVKKSQILSLGQFFMFDIYGDKITRYSDEAGGIYLIEEYESFVDEELRIDIKAFEEYQGSIFL